MAIARLAVMGVGAIGSTIGGYLTRAGADITLIDMWPAHVEAMQRRGLTVTAQDEEFTVKVKAVHLTDVCRLREQFDAVFLAVKSYDTVWATHFIRPYLTASGTVVSAQNSINEDLIAPIIGHTRTVGCVVALGAGLYEPAHVTRTSASSQPPFALGELNGMITPRVQELVTILSPVGPSHATANLWGDRWAKLIVNSMANALAGITGLGSADLRAHPDAFPILIKIAGEALQVAGVLGVQVEPVGGIPPQQYLDALQGVGRDTLRATLVERGRALGAGRPSLLQDISKGRRAEVDYLNGYVARKGREVAVPTPMNAAVVDLTKRVEAGNVKQEPGNLQLLSAHL
jgi:2-dehydropantoate 2-reductase